MLVLHGFWSRSGTLRLWAEDSDLLVKSPSQAVPSARPHPFAAAADAIAGIHPGKPGISVLLLPSLRSAPLDSPELIRVIPRPNARTDATLLAWTVPVVQLDAGAALAAIGEPIADIRYGASVGYLAELAAFACELVERGRVLPELRRDTRGAIACSASGVAGSRRGRDDSASKSSCGRSSHRRAGRARAPGRSGWPGAPPTPAHGHPAPTTRPQQISPRLRRLAEPVGKRDQFLGPSARTPIITSRHTLSSSKRTLRWIPSTHTYT